MSDLLDHTFEQGQPLVPYCQHWSTTTATLPDGTYIEWSSICGYLESSHPTSTKGDSVLNPPNMLNAVRQAILQNCHGKESDSSEGGPRFRFYEDELNGEFTPNLATFIAENVETEEAFRVFIEAEKVDGDE